MARPREFDVNDALDRGMHLLWARGYDATSLEELLASMGLSKSSFYDTFGSKRDFLIAALTRYIDVVLGQLAADLQHGSASKAITTAFLAAIPSPGGSARGCFVQNCAIEVAHRDPGARDKVRHGLKRLEDGFYRAVARGQQIGEFGRQQDPRALARFLVSSLNGLQVLARAGVDRRELKEIAMVTLRSLD